MKKNPIWPLMSLRYKSHPWHGVEIGDRAPEEVVAYIEIVPTDTVKYEIDKNTGYLKIDRPQKFSNVVPALYGFIPRTFCDKLVAAFSAMRSGKATLKGDGDPLDICVLSERNITHGDILVNAAPIGGFRLIDRGEADDKIIAVLSGDSIYESWKDISDCPVAVIDRLKHYFLTYKDIPGASKRDCEITHVYGREEAYEVIRKSQQDYTDRFGNLEELLTDALKE
jgi:inorganic pyrophosphatase